MRKICNRIMRLCSGLLTAVLVLLLAATLVQRINGELPGVFGYHLMYVLTGSMEPEIAAGDGVLVRECSAADLQVGDVICYRGTSGEMAGKMITHKLIRGPYEADGRTLLQTQGTANLTADDPIEAAQVYGKVVCKLLLSGKLYRLFGTVPGLILLCLPILWMIFDEAKNIIVCVRGEAKAPDENEEEEHRS